MSPRFTSCNNLLLDSRGVRMIAGSEGYWRNFPAPFDPSFHQALLKQMEAKRDELVGAPSCLGFSATINSCGTTTRFLQSAR